MKHKFSTAQEAIQVIKLNEDEYRISALLPLRHITSGQKEDWNNLDKLMKDVFEITEEIPEMDKGAFKDKLSELFRSIKFNRKDKGLGIYVSQKIFRFMTFPFEVKQSLVMGQAFQIKELYMLQQYAVEYMVLYLSEKMARAFTGFDGAIIEKKDDFFPAHYSDPFEYEHPSRSTSYAGSAHVKGFEKDRSIMEKLRFESFIHTIDKHLHQYLTPKSILIVCGNKSHTASFVEHSKYAENVISLIQGGYDWFDMIEFRELTWPVMQSNIENRLNLILEEFKERSGEGFSEEGMVQVWNAVQEGRVKTLLVENGYEIGGYIDSLTPNIFRPGLAPAAETYIPYAVNELVSLADRKGGEVVFVESGQLPEGDHVAAICRY